MKIFETNFLFIFETKHIFINLKIFHTMKMTYSDQLYSDTYLVILLLFIQISNIQIPFTELE